MNHDAVRLDFGEVVSHAVLDELSVAEFAFDEDEASFVDELLGVLDEREGVDSDAVPIGAFGDLRTVVERVASFGSGEREVGGGVVAREVGYFGLFADKSEKYDLVVVHELKCKGTQKLEFARDMYFGKRLDAKTIDGGDGEREASLMGGAEVGDVGGSGGRDGDDVGRVGGVRRFLAGGSVNDVVGNLLALFGRGGGLPIQSHGVGKVMSALDAREGDFLLAEGRAERVVGIGGGGDDVGDGRQRGIVVEIGAEGVEKSLLVAREEFGGVEDLPGAREFVKTLLTIVDGLPIEGHLLGELGRLLPSGVLLIEADAGGVHGNVEIGVALVVVPPREQFLVGREVMSQFPIKLRRDIVKVVVVEPEEYIGIEVIVVLKSLA